MTISEQLQFSVLTAPVAAVDRRSLSQAWYSALYGDGNGAAGRGAPASSAQADVRSACAHGAVRTVPEESRRVAAVPFGRVKQSVPQEAVPQERRGPRSALARKIERAFLRPRGAPRKASFTVESDGGRVHVLLRAAGPQLKLIAICPAKARAHVAAALAQARYALALRGIDLDADTRGGAAC